MTLPDAGPPPLGAPDASGVVDAPVVVAPVVVAPVVDAPVVDAPASRFDAPASPLPRPLAHWRFDESAGLTVEDASGNGHTGRLENIPASGAWVEGKLGGGLKLPSMTPSAGVRVELDDSIKRLQTFTMTAWTYRASFDENRNMSILSRQASGTDSEVFNLSLDGNLVRLWIRNTSDQRTSAAATVLDQPLDRWVHVAARLDATTLDVFIDGALASTQSHARGLLAADSPVYVGTNKNPQTADTPFDGILDDVRLYEVPLSNAELARVMLGQ